MSNGTARVIACPICHVQQFEHCVDIDGTERFHSHPERVAAAKQIDGLTPAHVEALRKLHTDPTRQLHPAMRNALVNRGLIEPAPSVPPPPSGKYKTYPKRRHPLTAAGLAAIGVAVQAKEIAL